MTQAVTERRRHAVLRVLAVLALSIPALQFTLLADGKAFAAESHNLQPASIPLRSVTCRLSVTGELRTNPSGSGVRRIPLKADGEVTYEEKTIGDGTPTRTARYYERATATIDAGNRAHAPQLRSDQQLMFAELNGDSSTIYSPRGPLFRTELDLVDLPGSSIVLPMLLPQDAKKLKDRWQHDPTTMSLLLGLDAVSQTDVQSELREIRDGAAKIAISGKLSGAADGVASDVELDGEYVFDLSQRCVTSLQLTISEERSIGHVAPGFKVKAELDVALRPIVRAAHLRPEVLADIPFRTTPSAQLLQFTSETGGFELRHDRRWHVMADINKTAVLRFVDQGDLVAQCNISGLADYPAGKQLALEEFRGDIQRALGDKFSQFAEVSQEASEGRRVLRVVAVGIVSELPIQWVYYHVSNDAGRRVAAVFTLETEFAERVRGPEDELIGSLRFSKAENVRRETATLATPGSDLPANSGRDQSTR